MTSNTPRPISYSDIRKGDKIQIDYDDRDTHIIIIATAFGKNYSDVWVTKEGVPLYFSFTNTEYSLLERPAPPVPDATGDVIRINRYYCEYDKEDRFPDNGTYAILDGDGDWIVILDGYHKYIDPSNIREWSPVTITIDEAKES